ncbi:hypothetical protein [Mergibacter septicus]|uniref:hypothetical protein n=1 Tax=Mergibacter septicus TaxID=221402 RepID=UPI00223EA349|nr:hypothetical protein [Mergibacter septicus]
MPAFALNGNCSDIVVMRIMCCRGFEMDFAALFMKAFKTALNYLLSQTKTTEKHCVNHV